jgi:hypothetical protein
MVNTVKGPSELKVPTRSAAVTAATKVLNEPIYGSFYNIHNTVVLFNVTVLLPKLSIVTVKILIK